MKKSLLSMMAALFPLIVLADATSGALQNRGQEMSNWCWAANSEMLLDWHGNETGQTQIADFAVAGANVGNYLSADGWGPFKIPGTDIVFFQKGIKQVLEHFGPIKSDVQNSALSENDAKDFLDRGKPFIVREDWSGGGAHVLVAKDYAGSDFKIEDPWPLNGQPAPGNPGVSASVAYSTLTGTTPDYRSVVFGLSGGNTWTETLTLGKSLDIVFLIDSTGSMGPYISNVKSQATALVSDLKSKFEDLRIAVVEYRDFPEYPYGDSGDYITSVKTSFTDDTDNAIAAIDSISVGGGADIPEALFSAVERTATGAEIGGWRTGNNVSRHIILMGDAPGHSPEPWTGGKSLDDCKTALQNPDHPASVQAVHVGSDDSAGADFSALAAVNNGQKVSTISADDVSGLISGLIEDISNGRFPIHETKNPYPVFTWPPLGSPMASSPMLKSLSVELEFNDPVRSWRKYKTIKVKDLGATSITANKLLPVGEYRWRLKGNTKSGKFLYPDATEAKSEKLGKFVEEAFTTFNRLSNAPGPITKFSSTCPFSTGATYDVYFEKDPDTEVYAVKRISQSGKEKIFKFKPKKLVEVETGVLSATLKVGKNENFCWYVQGLNYDRKKVDPEAFN